VRTEQMRWMAASASLYSSCGHARKMTQGDAPGADRADAVEGGVGVMGARVHPVDRIGA
jgi:hypothetical protein